MRQTSDCATTSNLSRETPRSATPQLHVMCERDVGLFSLIQQVVANIPWALHEGRIPVALFGDRCCYWTPAGYEGRDTVWEYYFEPLVTTHPASSVVPEVRKALDLGLPQEHELGTVYENTFCTSHFGDHPDLAGRALSIPYLWDDPDDTLRRRTSTIIAKYVRPRSYLLRKVDNFWNDRLAGTYNIGVHLRGTDAVSSLERRAHRLGSLSFRQYTNAIRQTIRKHPDCRIFVATDTQEAVSYLARQFGDRIVSYDALRHARGSAAGYGPNGGLLPAYIASDRDAAARNGEEAVIDYLLLGRCDILVHNSSGLARTVLLANPNIPHINTHLKRTILVPTLRYLQKRIQAYRRWRGETDAARIGSLGNVQ